MAKINLVLILGQSNAVGRALWERAGSNTNYNYKGIANPSTGYPAVSNGRPMYVKQPSGVYIYNFGDDRNQDYIVANGTWEPLNAGVNTHTDQAGLSTALYFGCEVSLGQQLKDITGNDTYFVKPAWGATGIGYDTAPGTWPSWLWYYRNVADLLITRSINSLKAARPNDEIVFQGVVWWQGEANQSASAAQYKLYWYRVYNYINNVILGVLNMPSQPKWYNVKLYYSLNAGEAEKNLAFDQLATENPGVVFATTAEGFPRKVDLTVAEAAPVAKATSGNNSAGVPDDTHNTYISQLGVGERIATLMTGVAI